MRSKRNPSKEGITRGKFLSFLGKIGILALIPGIPANAADRKSVEVKDAHDKIGCACFGILDRGALSPRIKGKTLSREALTAKLATDNLEQLRDLVTGRFFGKAAEEAFAGGYLPVINWDLGTGGGDSGCFLFADLRGSANPDPGLNVNCVAKLLIRDSADKIIIDVYSTPAGISLPGDPSSNCPEKGICPSQCPSYCGDKCSGVYCSGPYCSPQASINLYEIVSYPADKFASELTRIIDSTDVGIIKEELQAIVFSDEVLNLGLQQFVTSAYEGMIDDVAGFQY